MLNVKSAFNLLYCEMTYTEIVKFMTVANLLNRGYLVY